MSISLCEPSIHTRTSYMRIIHTNIASIYVAWVALLYVASFLCRKVYMCRLTAFVHEKSNRQSAMSGNTCSVLSRRMYQHYALRFLCAKTSETIQTTACRSFPPCSPFECFVPYFRVLLMRMPPATCMPHVFVYVCL